MKAHFTLGQLAVVLLSLSHAANALSWPRWLPDIDTLIVRQEDDSKESETSPTPTAKPTSAKDDPDDTEDKPTTSRNPFEPITTNLNTGGLTKSATATGKVTGNATTTRPPRKTQFNPMDPAGSVVMLTPAPTEAFPLYKIGDYITWGWNYTNLQATPTAIDLYVKCSKVPQPWTLTQNMTWATKGEYTWDTKAFQTEHVENPLLTEQYTLVIADAETGPSATPEAGYLAPFSGFHFGLYKPMDYQDSADGWTCASCSGARRATGVDVKGLGMALGMCVVTVVSFTWFVVGIGMF